MQKNITGKKRISTKKTTVKMKNRIDETNTNGMERKFLHKCLAVVPIRMAHLENVY